MKPKCYRAYLSRVKCNGPVTSEDGGCLYCCQTHLLESELRCFEQNFNRALRALDRLLGDLYTLNAKIMRHHREGKHK